MRVGVIVRVAQRMLPHHRAIALALLRQLNRAAAHAGDLLCHVTNTFELFLQKVFSHCRSPISSPWRLRMSCQPSGGKIRVQSRWPAEIETVPSRRSAHLKSQKSLALTYVAQAFRPAAPHGQG